MFVAISNRFAELLEQKQKKEDRYISLAEVANDTGVSRKTLYKWERKTLDRFDADTVEKLCKYFGVGLSELLEYAPNEKKTARK